MSARPGIRKTVRVSADSGIKDEITAEVRVHWPPNADPREVARAVLDAANDVLDALDAEGFLLLSPVLLHAAVL
jgi:hypothetical protein